MLRPSLSNPFRRPRPQRETSRVNGNLNDERGNMDESFVSDGEGGARPRRQTSRRSRGPAVIQLAKSSSPFAPSKRRGDACDRDEDVEDEEEEEEEEEEEIEVEAVDAHGAAGKDAANRSVGGPSGSTDMQAFEKGAMVRIMRTSDVEQRVPHTIGKIGLVEEAPQHPNTWFKVRIRDGDVVYKYRPSALFLAAAEDEDTAIDDHDAADQVNSTNDSRRYHDDQGGDDTDGVGESESEQKGTGEDGEDGEQEDMEIDTRVRIQLGALSRRERELKKYNGKLGVIIASETDGFKVQLDTEDIITIKQKHLVAAPDAPRLEEPADGDTEDQSDADLPKGQLLSDLDPDMWIDRKCRINVGKFKGRHGRVLRSGNGWVQLRLENSNENTAKRAYELTLLEDLDTIKDLYSKSLSRKRDQGVDDEDEEDDDDDGDEGGRSGTDDNFNADQGDESQGEDGGKRSRRLATRGNYGISWIERKVFLPNRKGVGIVKRADRETCTVEVGTSKVLRVFKKRDLELIDDDSSKAGRGQRNRNNAKVKDRLGLPEGATLMGTTAARYAAFQDQVKKMAIRRREKTKKRPYLLGWKAEFEAKLRSSHAQDQEDPSVVDLIIVPSCEICGIEKEELSGDCWNSKCPRSMKFDLDSYEPSEDYVARFPITPIPTDRITNTVCLTADELLRKRKRRQTVSPRHLDPSSGESVSFSPRERGLKRQVSSDSIRSDSKRTKKDSAKAKKANLSGEKKSKKSRGKSSPYRGDNGVSTKAMKSETLSPADGYQLEEERMYSR